MNRALPWMVRTAVLLFWQAVSQVGLLADKIMPAPTAVAEAFWRVTSSGELLRDISVSAGRAFAGFAIGGGIGFALGMVNGLSSLSEKPTDTTTQMIPHIPPPALIPLVLLWVALRHAAQSVPR